jgi:predicted solute-binding protein
VIHRKKALGIPPYYYCAPVVADLVDQGSYELRVSAPALLAVQLRQRILHAGFLTPSDYARDSSNYQIVPNAAVVSDSLSGPVSLHFRRGLHTISTLAADPSSSAEIVLARIILAEEFESFPILVPVCGSVDEMLAVADAALLVGETVQEGHSHRKDSVDVVEAWYELTELPYVYGFWCGREHSLSEVDVQNIQMVHTRVHESSRQPTSDTAGEQQERFAYLFSAAAEEAVREFFHYAFYHGILQDVSDLTYFPSRASTNDPADDLDRN